jgi:serine/threonine protein kinase
MTKNVKTVCYYFVLLMFSNVSLSMHKSVQGNDDRRIEYFSPDLWNNISHLTQEYLLKNELLFPQNLTGNYRYYKIEDEDFIIDFNKSIGFRQSSLVFLGQNLTTKEFLAFKIVAKDVDRSEGNIQEVVALRNLNRLKELIYDKSRKEVYAVMPLINGIPIDKYDYKKHCNDLKVALKLAISYLDELRFAALSNVTQPKQYPGNVMIDLIKKEVFLIDFGGAGVFNSRTHMFYPDPLYPYINIHDIATVIDLLPKPELLKNNYRYDNYIGGNINIYKDYRKFSSYLKKLRDSSPRHEKNGYYLYLTIDRLQSLLFKFATVNGLNNYSL